METVLILVVALAGIAVTSRSQRRSRRDDDDGDDRDTLLRRLEVSERERKLLAARVENLESIVTDASVQLNQRINRLLGRTEPPRRAIAEPAPKPQENVAVAKTLTAAVAEPRIATARGELEPGNVIDNRYRIERLIGRGGMGTVFLAHDEVLEERVALKVISSLIADDPIAMVARFRREAAAARRISSPNVVRIHDIGETDGGLVYISMEYLVGQTLTKVIETRHPTPIDAALGLVDQVCTGLAAAHAGGVIHRDLKPGNVLVGERDAVKIIDFGLAKSGFLDGMTATGTMLGTPAYMAPEQVKGLDVDERTDIYALGALTYFIVTGQPPFSGATPIAVGFAQCATPPRPPCVLRPDLPAALNAAILTALEKDPAHRQRSVDAFRAALRGD